MARHPSIPCMKDPVSRTYVLCMIHLDSCEIWTFCSYFLTMVSNAEPAINLSQWRNETLTQLKTYRLTDLQTYRTTDLQTYRLTELQTYRPTDLQRFTYILLTYFFFYSSWSTDAIHNRAKRVYMDWVWINPEKLKKWLYIIWTFKIPWNSHLERIRI